jgi:hypothetical protein
MGLLYLYLYNIHQFHVPPHTVYLCVLRGSQNKQRLFPYTVLNDWFFKTEMEGVYCAVRIEYLDVTQADFFL